MKRASEIHQSHGSKKTHLFSTIVILITRTYWAQSACNRQMGRFWPEPAPLRHRRTVRSQIRRRVQLRRFWPKPTLLRKSGAIRSQVPCRFWLENRPMVDRWVSRRLLHSMTGAEPQRTWQQWVSEQLLNGTSAHIRLFSDITTDADTIPVWRNPRSQRRRPRRFC